MLNYKVHSKYYSKGYGATENKGCCAMEQSLDATSYLEDTLLKHRSSWSTYSNTKVKGRDHKQAEYTVSVLHGKSFQQNVMLL